MGKFVVVVIAIAILSFVAADLLGPNSSLIGSNNEVGEIAGETIPFKEYQEAIEQREQDFSLYTGQQPGPQQQPTIREQAWQLLINRYAFEKQYNELGVTVSPEEESDMILGRNIDPTIQGLFRNPQTGQFDRDQLLNFINNIESSPAQYQVLWNSVRSNLIPARKRIKYENLLIKGAYVTKAEAERSYHEQNDVAEVRYLFVPYPTVSESDINVTDQDIQSYYNDHKDLYETDGSRSIKYVSFPILPTKEDSLAAEEEVVNLKNTFAEVEDDSIFAARQSDGFDFYQTYPEQNLPVYLKPMADSLREGSVYGPYLGPTGYSVYKVIKLHSDTALYDIARIVRNVIASEETRNVAARKADLFASDAKDAASFESMTAEQGLTALPVNDLGKNDQRVMGLGDARELVRWLYRDADVGDVSEDFEINDQYVIALMTDEVPAGITPLEGVRQEIRQKVANQKKADIILGNLKDTSGTLEEIASAYGENANVYSSSDLRMETNILPNVGFDPEAIGVAFSLENGERSAPFAGESGVLIMEMQNKTESPEIADYTTFAQQLESTKQSRYTQNISNAITEDADITDERYKFY